MEMTIKVTPSEDSVKYAVNIDDKPVKLVNGTAKVDVSPISKHYFTWYVFGSTGSSARFEGKTQFRTVIEIDKEETQVKHESKSYGTKGFTL